MLTSACARLKVMMEAREEELRRQQEQEQLRHSEEMHADIRRNLQTLLQDDASEGACACLRVMGECVCSRACGFVDVFSSDNYGSSDGWLAILLRKRLTAAAPKVMCTT